MDELLIATVSAAVFVGGVATFVIGMMNDDLLVAAAGAIGIWFGPLFAYHVLPWRSEQTAGTEDAGMGE